LINSGKKIVGKNWLNQMFSILEPKKRKKLLIMTLLNMSTSFLDLVGVGTLGALGALSIQSIESRKAGNHVLKILKILGLANFSFHTQIILLGLFSAIILVSKTATSSLLTRKTLLFLSRESTLLSGKMMEKFLTQDRVLAQDRTSQELLYGLSDGVRNILIGVIATSSTLVADCATLLILSTGLMVIDPYVASLSVLFFLSIGFLLYKLLHRRANEIGAAYSKGMVAINQKTLELLNAFRELFVRNRQQYYLEQITALRSNLGDITAEISFQPYMSKYIIELSSVLGAVALASFEIGSKNAVHAAATLTVFLAASSRIAPAILRIQQGLLTIRNSQGASKTTMTLYLDLADRGRLSQSVKNVDFNHPGFTSTIEIKSLEFSYPGKDSFSLKNVNLSIPPGSFVAIVGPSGSGKSTLVDLILGVLSPSSGGISISGLSPKEAAEKWSGAIAYVPQSIYMTSGTIRENICLGYPINLALGESVLSALEQANLLSEVRDLAEDLNFEVGENGFKLSGGQRQRLGIARAFFTRPKLLILDEATSSLDAQSEELVTKSIVERRDFTTVIVVAHRLSTVRKADLVIYLEEGHILKSGTFEQVRVSIPNFDEQAKLMGL
jgi:ATP-binding cassette, subfamily B, bacterial PglK